MDRRARLQFMLLTADAQRSAIRRLALSGLNEGEIARATGWKAADIRGVLGPPVIADFVTWAPRRNPRLEAAAQVRVRAQRVPSGGIDNDQCR